MAIIKQYHADTDTTYVYSSEYFWDPVKKQSRSKRRVIGKIDPETGEVVPTGKRGRRPGKEVQKDPGQADSSLPDDTGSVPAVAQDKDQTIRELRLSLSQKEEQIHALERQNSQYATQLSKIRRQLSACVDSIDVVE